jgi:class 3 adenylate cyclase
MSETAALFDVLRHSADPAAAKAIEQLVAEGSDRALCRLNVLDFAKANDLDEEKSIAAFLHAARLGIFDMSWNMLCPGCGGVLEAGATLKSIDHHEYDCSLCATGYEPTLDEMVEVVFTVSPRVRPIAGHDPDSLPYIEYARQHFWGTGIDLPDDLEHRFDDFAVEVIELPPGEKALLSIVLPPEFCIVFDPVTHMTHFIDVQGEPTRERQALSLAITGEHAKTETVRMQPGPLRISFENKTGRRVLPGLWIANHALHDMMGKRKPFLTAKRLLTNQTFRDIYRTDTMDVDQRLKITSLTFLFTDLKGSTQLYERVGDLAAYDLVRHHFRVVNEIVASEAGAVVKTIGDAVMATFQTPDHALSAALRMREAMQKINAERGSEDLLLKIGIHEGPCLAVTLNDRQDYFGHTVNTAARVQSLASSRAIFATTSVVEDAQSSKILQSSGLVPVQQRAALRGITDEMLVYEIP